MKKILIVDDIASIVSSLRDILAEALDECEFFGAENGVQALMVMEDVDIDLLITDIVMPEKEGLETISEVREKFPEMKIIAMTGGGKMGKINFLHLAKMLGASYVFNKPFNPKEMVEAVQATLEN